MNNAAPRCIEAMSFGLIWLGCSAPPEAARASAGENASRNAISRLVMLGHPLRNRLGRVDTRPDRHGDEEGEVVEGEDPRSPGLRRAAGLQAQPAQADEGDHENRDQDLRQPAAVAD